MNSASNESDARPERQPAPVRYILKPREFTPVNAAPGTEARSADHDVFAILQQVRAREAAAGLDKIAPVAPLKSRRKRDYWLLLIGGNGLMLTLFLVQLFIGFQVQCLAAHMPGELNNLFRYALHDGRPMFLLPGLCMTGYSTALTWLMFGVMGRY